MVPLVAAAVFGNKDVVDFLLTLDAYSKVADPFVLAAVAISPSVQASPLFTSRSFPSSPFQDLDRWGKLPPSPPLFRTYHTPLRVG